MSAFDLQTTRQFCEAVWRYAREQMVKQQSDKWLIPENYWTFDEAVNAVIRTLHVGWIYYDGAEIRDHEFVAVRPEAAREYLLHGTPWTEADVMKEPDRS